MHLHECQFGVKTKTKHSPVSCLPGKNFGVGRSEKDLINILFLYSRAMKMQHPNVHQYLQDIFKILSPCSQRISDDFYEYKRQTPY